VSCFSAHFFRSCAPGINGPTAAGVVQIVGQSGWETSLATLWTVDADEKIRAVDPGAPRNSISASALGINAQGWIVGRSVSRTLSRRPTLWLPQEGGGGDNDDTCNPHPRTGVCRG
jgi:hypothetical protein